MRLLGFELVLGMLKGLPALQLPRKCFHRFTPRRLSDKKWQTASQNSKIIHLVLILQVCKIQKLKGP